MLDSAAINNITPFSPIRKVNAPANASVLYRNNQATFLQSNIANNIIQNQTKMPKVRQFQ